MDNANHWNVDVGSDVFHAGTNEDGEEREGLRFFVVAENRWGRRFRHVMTYDSMNRGMRDAMEAKAVRLASRVNAAQAVGGWNGPVDNCMWEEYDPAYGSLAWVAQNMDSVERDREFNGL